MVALIVLFLLAAAVAAFVLVRRRKQQKLNAMSPAERELHDAQDEYDLAVRAAERNLAAELKARDRRIKQATAMVSAAVAMGNRTLGSYRGKDGAVTVTERVITTSQGTFPLNPNVTAVADTAGGLATSSRSTLTRIAAGGLLLGPAGMLLGGIAKKSKVHDTRELYLLVESPNQFAVLVTCDPNDGQKVRQLAMTIRQAAINSTVAAERRAIAAAEAQQSLEREQMDEVAVLAASAALEAAKSNTGRLAQAQLALPVAPPSAA
ncbi:hypothetical protein [Curtobacterium ammoniigenes]|uniref:hypothetical protein n=1 Tax=Curtobacterium ammoniigenes TaxID=395387 RepID=UPI00082D2F2A|nr:hypothetical protein [Curtobacterium ammoniigenes]